MSGDNGVAAQQGNGAPGMRYPGGLFLFDPGRFPAGIHQGGQMAKIRFWEKPGCKGNTRQKEILLASGHELEVRNLLTEPWSEAELQKFFGDRPVAEWFNPSNPRVKSGELDTAAVKREEALAMMVAEPLLIVRPLMQVEGERLAGFEVAEVHNWVGLNLASVGERDPKNCPCVTGPGRSAGTLPA